MEERRIMTIAELKKRLDKFPDSAVIEVSCADIDSEDRWFEITELIGDDDENPEVSEHVLVLLGSPVSYGVV